MLLPLFLAAITLFRLIVGRYLPIIGDEAFYWLWSKHLDLSYVDHPPMIAYYIKSLTLLLGDTEFAIRLGAIILVTLTSILIYNIGKELFSKKAGLLALIIFNLIPTFLAGSIFLVPQQPLILFWALSMFIFIKIIRSGNKHLWYLLGLGVGLGLLSDYVMLLFFPAVGLYLLLNQNLRFWWKKTEPYLAAILSFIIFSPVIIWNIRNGFTPLFYWSGKMGATPNYLQNILSFVSLEMLLYTPVVFILVIFLIINLFREKDQNHLLLGCFCAPVFLAFSLISPLIMVGGHWPATAYLPAIVYLGQTKNKWLIYLTLFFALFVNIAGMAYYLFLYPIPKTMAGQELNINHKLPAYINKVTPQEGITFYFANNLGLAGLVEFHGKVKVFLAPGRLKQFDLWGKPNLQKGDSLVYFALNESELYDKLIPLFSQVKKETTPQIFTKDADVPSKTLIFICRDFKGGTLP